MYFDHEETIRWAHAVRQLALDSEAVTGGQVELLIFPSFVSIPALVDIFSDVPVMVGGQNMASHPRGAFTGEVGPLALKQVGATHVEIGHAERRRLFGESITDIQNKISLALDVELVPLLCLGEKEETSPREAADICIQFITQATAEVAHHSLPMVFAYEPEWAIGAERPADSEYVRETILHLRRWVDDQPRFTGSAIIYGGSAGPGLFTELRGAVDGLFLGRFAHDPAALDEVLTEAARTVPSPNPQKH